MSSRRIGIMIVVLTSLGVLSWRLLPATEQTQSTGGYPPAVVELSSVQSQIPPRLLHAVGTLEAWQQVLLSAQTSGRIRKIEFASGQAVQTGQPLLLLDDELEQAGVHREQAKVKQTAIQLMRVRKLKEQQAATQEQLDQAQADHAMAQAQLQYQQAALGLKQVNAPFSGQIGITHLHQGHYLQPGQPIASLVDDSRLRINLTVPEHGLPDLSVGQQLQVQLDAWPGEHFQAQISAIDPLIGDSRTVRLQALLPNPERRLKAGMYARVQLKRPAPSSVLTVPETALTYTAYGQTVFVASPASQGLWQVKRVAVQTGEQWDERVEITDGLKEGDRVVSAGQIKIQDGSTVQTAQRKEPV